MDTFRFCFWILLRFFFKLFRIDFKSFQGQFCSADVLPQSLNNEVRVRPLLPALISDHCVLEPPKGAFALLPRNRLENSKIRQSNLLVNLSLLSSEDFWVLLSFTSGRSIFSTFVGRYKNAGDRWAKGGKPRNLH